MTKVPHYAERHPSLDTSFPFWLRLKTYTNIPAHRHDFLEICLVLEGYGTELVDGVPHALKSGTFTFLLPHQVHEFHAAQDSSLLVYVCNFDLNLLFDSNEHDWGLQELLTEDSDELPPFLYLNEPQFQDMKQIFERMRTEYDGQERWNYVLLRAKLHEALILFDRLRRQALPAEQPIHPVSPNRDIKKAINYLHNHYDHPITLSFLAEKFHYSESVLSKSFKRHLGQNFMDFLHEVRIRHACNLLGSTEMSISEIALEVGFGSFASFSRSFQKLKRCTPSHYRKTRSGLQQTVDPAN